MMNIFIPKKEALPPTSMSDFGNVISGWDWHGISESINGAAIADWEDTFGSNDLTPYDGDEDITLLLTSYGKEVFINYDLPLAGAFSAGSPSNLNFISNANSFSIIVKNGSVIDNTGSAIIGWSSYTTDIKYYIEHAPGGVKFVVGNDELISAQEIEAYDTVICTYNHITSEAKIYINGTNVATATLTPSVVTANNFGLGIGQVSNKENVMYGSLGGIWIFDEVKTASDAVGITALLTTQF